MTLHHWFDLISAAAQIAIIALFVVLAIIGFLHRKTPQIGGKIGKRRSLAATDVPIGFSSTSECAATVFVATSSAADFATLKEFLRLGTTPRTIPMRIYRVAGSKTEIEISAEPPNYERIDAVQTLALLRELPDLRLIRRLHLSDDVSFLQPWARKLTTPNAVLLGHATNFSLVVLYKPDRRLGPILGLTLLHEWLHLVAFRSTWCIHRFKRASAIEPLPHQDVLPLSVGAFGDGNSSIYEAWCELGEKVLGYDDAIAREAALTYPLHTMILWARVEKIWRKTPPNLRSTRLADFETRAQFIHSEVAAKARAAKRQAIGPPK